MNTLIRLDILADDGQLDPVTGVLALRVSFGWEEESLPTGETRFRVHCGNADFMQALAEELRDRIPGLRLETADVPEEDWTMAWREFFTPVACGTRFLVLPPWLRESVDMNGRTPVYIEPKSAFGTGHHATTALCLGVLSDLLDAGRVKAGMEFLDLGTGSGILGIGCCLSGLTGVGADIDPLAVENARENRTLNGVRGFEILSGSTEAVAGRAFDLVLANILARPLRELAPDIVKLLRPGGCLVLSGLLEVQADDVEAAYTALGLPCARRIVEGDWAALVWE
ncbi:MAG: 50S ribosomal protein L11 methyltransferase [Desulfovibrionaceae bacterium]|nr:50S ribosomal protein L11 methyltransferase [Desulfovibrionaceae bacterium]